MWDIANRQRGNPALRLVIPALNRNPNHKYWIPACAGMTFVGYLCHKTLLNSAKQSSIMLCMRNFDKAKRVVIKIGTNILSKEDSIDAGYVGLMRSEERRVGKEC